ncbi:MAG: DUF4410 domain-containing protein [Pseudomonas sp.]|uniref:DUF4410 domain-containing protein n=1 Tax=Pseudomonas sp. TaxID=306 RepID=UPI002733DD30|nr:DUF4410 domain-containing protein [Pseudomonas sp.]MDP3845919.1 DUF4410 domain-containing protein [Pseudomonas sp.]
MNNISPCCGYFQVGFLRAVRYRLPTLFLGACLVVSAGSVAGAPKILGGIELQSETRGSATPIVAAQVVYIADFSLNVVAETAEAAPAGPLARLAQRLPRSSSAADKQKPAQETVEQMSIALIESLAQQGLAAQRIPDIGKLPGSGWLIQGVFVEVDEGSGVKRAAIGFGSGTSSMEVQASVSDLTGPQPLYPFLLVGTQKTPNKMPGAIVTKNPYVAAAKLVMGRNASEKDIRKTAEKIAEEVLKYRQRLRQGTSEGTAAP